MSPDFWWGLGTGFATAFGGVFVLSLCRIAGDADRAAERDRQPCCGCCHQEPGKQLIPCQHCPRHGHLADRVGFSLVGLECPYRQTRRWTDEAAPSVEAT